MAYLSIEPDVGTRADWLATTLVAALARIEATLGGKPVKTDGKVIEWGTTQEADEATIAGVLDRIINGNRTTRH